MKLFVNTYSLEFALNRRFQESLSYGIGLRVLPGAEASCGTVCRASSWEADGPNENAWFYLWLI